MLKIKKSLIASKIVAKAFGREPKRPRREPKSLKESKLSSADLDKPTLSAGRYRHVNGAIVDVIGAAHDGLNYEEYILYKNGGGNLAVLPITEFLKAVLDDDGKEVARFSPIK